MTAPPDPPSPPGAPPLLHEGRAEPARLAQRAGSRRTAVLVGTLAMATLVYWLTREAVGEMGARALAIIVIAALFWATEALPLFATAFVVVGLEILLLATDGGLADVLTALLHAVGIAVVSPSPEMDAAQFLAPLASDIVILFLGAFLLAAAVRKHQVDELIAARVLRPFSRTPLWLLYGVLGITAVLSMWMSNTATGGPPESSPPTDPTVAPANGLLRQVVPRPDGADHIRDRLGAGTRGVTPSTYFARCRTCASAAVLIEQAHLAARLLRHRQRNRLPDGQAADLPATGGLGVYETLARMHRDGLPS